MLRVQGKPRHIRIVCPRDGGRLVWDEAGLTCPKCGGEWEREGDVPVFARAAAAETAPPARREAPTGTGDSGDFEAAPDWRLLLPLGPKSRVLLVGFRDEGFVDAIAPDVDTIGTLEAGGAGANLDNVVPVVSESGLVPFPDGAFDLVVLDPDLLPSGRHRRRARLSMLCRKLRDDGRLFLPVENHWGRLFPGPHDSPQEKRRGGDLGMDGWRRLLRASGFARADFHAAFPDARRPRELIPLDDPAAFDWWWARSRRGGAPLARLANRCGLLPRLAPHFAVVARKDARR